MTFNPELIAKARKGEIAILNDGSVEELKIVLTAIWPDDTATVHISSCSSRYFIVSSYNKLKWTGEHVVRIPFHSVKDFFMPDTKEPEIVWNSESFIKDDRPRTYKVTRQQMKEIHDSISRAPGRVVIDLIMKDNFSPYENEATFTDTHVSMLKSTDADIDILKKLFSEYFFIPEGEPVLVRDSDHVRWSIGISDGNGHASSEVGGSPYSFKQIIPYTKQPPK